MQVLAIFICVSSCFDLYSLITAKYGINNLAALHVYTIIEYSFIAYFFSTLKLLKKIQGIILISIVLFSFGSLYHSFFIADISHFNNISRTTECILLFMIGAYYSIEFYIQEPDDYPSLIRYPYFWVSTGVILYFGGNIVNFAMYQLLTASPSEGKSLDYWDIHSLFNITTNIFYFIAFIWSPRQPK